MSMHFVWGYMPNIAEGKDKMLQFWRQMSSLMRARLEGMAVVAYFPQTRSQQNTYNSALQDLADQLELGGEKRQPIVWKRFMLATLYEHTRHDPQFMEEWKAIDPVLLPDMDGDGLHLIALSTKPLTRELAGIFLNLCHSYGDERGVKWKPQSLGRQEAANDASAAQREAA
ncbi:recombination protein NinB [Roseateles terrae]|uniref:Uncharacterized protein n=1 Tax=Roseateles terrae TaxID=431060 RepID=A0ABR6GPB3_9BURK|nr:recombination protein NinB [Roseateles terrae]MBB3193958.1 hypothetical protein [Roseateles terrae]OWQ87834.1 hypothetical protein CDN98_06625 [Roseateles terrae]